MHAHLSNVVYFLNNAKYKTWLSDRKVIESEVQTGDTRRERSGETCE